MSRFLLESHKLVRIFQLDSVAVILSLEVSLYFQKEKRGGFGIVKVIRTPDVTVFQGKTAGFILRATAQLPCDEPLWLTVQWPSSTVQSSTFLPAQPRLRRCVKFKKALRLLWIRSGWNPPPVWSDLHSLCLVNLRDPFGLQHGLLASVKSPDFRRASVCYVRVNERELGRWIRSAITK